MSIQSWKKTWGTLVPLLQKKANSQTETDLLDNKMEYAIANLLQKKVNINDASPVVQCTFLHLCIGKGLAKSAERLIKSGADIQKENLFREKPVDYIRYAQYNQEKMKPLFCSPAFLIRQNSR